MKTIALVWDGKDKYHLKEDIDFELVHQHSIPQKEEAWTNKIFHGDLRKVISCYTQEFHEQFQMIYVDPPFFSGQRFHYKDKDSQNPGRRELAYDDRWKKGKEEYLNLLYQSISLFHKILKPSGLLFVHVDYRADAYAKLILDEVFGEGHFINEIIWNYNSGGRAKRHFSRKHDNILIYGKTKNYSFYPYEVSIPRGPQRRNHMRKSKDEDGRVYYSIHSSGKEYRYYEDDRILLSDVWTDISHLHQKDPERTGYDTQKPQALLERIIKSSTQPGDLVGDFFCGSGTTLAVAQKNGRRWVGCDSSEIAVEVCGKRLEGSYDGVQFMMLKEKKK